MTFRNRANGVAAWANPHGVLDWERPVRSRNRDALRFRVLGLGRVVLQAMEGSGFLTVVGRGLPSDVRLMKSESPGSLFQWQGMLRQPFMLLSLQTNRYLGIGPETREPYAADWPTAARSQGLKRAAVASGGEQHESECARPTDRSGCGNLPD